MAAFQSLLGLPTPIDPLLQGLIARAHADKQNPLFLRILDPYCGVAGIFTLDIEYWA